MRSNFTVKGKVYNFADDRRKYTLQYKETKGWFEPITSHISPVLNFWMYEKGESEKRKTKKSIRTGLLIHKTQL